MPGRRPGWRRLDVAYLMFAQSLGEYGGASGQIGTGAQDVIGSMSRWIGDASPVTWLLVGAIVLSVLWYWGRR